jgi:hypothetical protein
MKPSAPDANEFISLNAVRPPKIIYEVPALVKVFGSAECAPTMISSFPSPLISPAPLTAYPNSSFTATPANSKPMEGIDVKPKLSYSLKVVVLA